ncbi:LysR family transcriptional regulator [Pendulispora rubella]|uniref:LysR family transcriptional regulator n=1 Tax=Pendulispora rubella TaxID=2741070 RepID=A0ABZ2KXV2_9BACT
MRIFRSIVSTGSFAGAARVARTTPTWVSKQLAQLEDHLGTQLLHRNTRGLSLSEAGRLYLERCERILEEVDGAEHLLNSWRTVPRGPVRISAPMAFGLVRLSPLFAPFAVKYPEVELDVVLNDRVVDLVEEGFDLGIRVFRRPLDDSTLTVRRIGGGRRVVCAAPSYLAVHGRPTHPRDLEDHVCLRYGKQMPGYWEFDGPDGRVGVKVGGPLIVNNSLAIRHAVTSGLGIALVKDFIVAKELAEHALEVLLEDYPPNGYSIFVVSPPSRYETPRVRAVTDFLVEALGAG